MHQPTSRRTLASFRRQRAFGCGKANERIYERHEQTADKRGKQAEKQRRGHIQRSCARQRPGCSSRAAHYRKQQLGIRLHFIQHRGCQTEHTFHIGCEQQRDSQRSCHGLNMQPVVRDALAHKLADERSRQQQRRRLHGLPQCTDRQPGGPFDDRKDRFAGVRARCRAVRAQRVLARRPAGRPSACPHSGSAVPPPKHPAQEPGTVSTARIQRRITQRRISASDHRLQQRKHHFQKRQRKIKADKAAADLDGLRKRLLAAVPADRCGHLRPAVQWRLF